MQQIRKIFSATKELKRYYIAIGCFTVFSALLTLLLPAVTGKVIDLFGQGEDFDISKAV